MKPVPQLSRLSVSARTPKHDKPIVGQCERCGEYLNAGMRTCPNCGHYNN